MRAERNRSHSPGQRAKFAWCNVCRKLTATAASLLIVCAMGASAAAAEGSANPALSSAEREKAALFFESRIRPLLAQHCYDCHGPDTQESELRLDTWAGLAAGGASGPLIRPGHPDQSLLMLAVGYQDSSLEMPPDEKLSDRQIADLRQWIAQGALHPDADPSVTVAKRERAMSASDEDPLWSLQPIGRPVPPTHDGDVAANPVDAFVLARLQEAGIAPNPAADKRTLIRRATFDLTGLPPTPVEVDRFLADDAPDAYARLVDRLLASPAYGQRWGRHWLDVARYADSNGLDENVAHGNAWRYRNWVVDAWNADLPYDRFVQLQIAGDLLPIEDPIVRQDALIATGFLTLGPKVLAEADKQKMEMDIIDEQLDTLGRSMLGLTIGCARCHDHKFDPILAEDYYALAGIFKSTQTMDSLKTIAKWHENEIATPEQLAAQQRHRQQIAKQQQAVETLIADANASLRQQLGPGAAFPKDPEKHYPKPTQEQIAAVRKQLEELEKNPPAVDTAMGVAEGEPTDLAIHLRGSHLSLGDVAPRDFPDWVPVSQQWKIPADQSGRLELAGWITDPENPLAWRVIANRLWRWHFGRGLVASVDNFGRIGDQPSHPELLDYLARQLADHGGSLKRLQRMIMLSSTYQMSSRQQSTASQIDPENRLLWRAPLRRLEAEALRDALLMVSGSLDRRIGQSLLHVGNREFLFNHTSKDDTSYDSYLRSLYLPVIRNNLYDAFQLFDYTDAGVINGDRSTTTVATQSLFLMNSPLVQQSAASLARRVLQSSVAEDPAERLYLIAVGRPPTDQERDDVHQSIQMLLQQLADAPPPKAAAAESQQPTAEQRAWSVICHALLASNEFVYLR